MARHPKQVCKPEAKEPQRRGLAGQGYSPTEKALSGPPSSSTGGLSIQPLQGPPRPGLPAPPNGDQETRCQHLKREIPRNESSNTSEEDNWEKKSKLHSKSLCLGRT
ncbi:hypothetical protein D623_10018030 [Myotis brandtii]|uniref:Uncharacterized protein n=1 Tax=Myotis brandtii TaxID=109478 RepID=S7NIQ0_MYOBR|nr:hypothetical protein D623_10018030 [Myotis brandtii]